MKINLTDTFAFKVFCSVRQVLDRQELLQCLLWGRLLVSDLLQNKQRFVLCTELPPEAGELCFLYLEQFEL